MTIVIRNNTWNLELIYSECLKYYQNKEFDLYNRVGRSVAGVSRVLSCL